MINQIDIEKIKNTTDEFFQKMTIKLSYVEVNKTMVEKVIKKIPSFRGAEKDDKKSGNEEITDVINLNITIEEPQILIGEKGQTLFEIQRLLKAILSKKIQKIFFLNLDINKYKQGKIEYLKKISREAADEVSINKEEKSLFPMSAYERRIVHAELTQRPDIITESRGEGASRYIVIKPK